MSAVTISPMATHSSTGEAPTGTSFEIRRLEAQHDERNQERQPGRVGRADEQPPGDGAGDPLGQRGGAVRLIAAVDSAPDGTAAAAPGLAGGPW